MQRKNLKRLNIQLQNNLRTHFDHKRPSLRHIQIGHAVKKIYSEKFKDVFYPIAQFDVRSGGI